jgi:arylsulfatase A-like enzyme
MTAPNIIFILIDDMGWRDLSCYGSTFYETPHIDRLAQQSMRFSDAYAACPVCSPTRASLLTGRYPARVGVTDWINHSKDTHPCRGRLIDAPYVDHLPHSERSIAAALRAGGYQTWHVGKWHLGAEPYYPEHHGFDINLGGWQRGCPTSYFAPWHIPNLPEQPDGTYLDDYLTDEAIRLLRDRDPGRPFFLNLWYYLVHTPLQAKAELIDKYKRKARKLGLDAIDPFIDAGPHPAQHMQPRHIMRRIIQSDPVYAAMVDTLDANIGRLMHALEHAGIAEDTIVIFTSDNGGLATTEGSPTCNLPLAEGKGWIYEGGTRTPLMVRYPGVTQPGSTCDAPVTSPDFYPTLLEAAGLDPLPDQHADGISLMPLLRGERAIDREAIYWHYPHYGNQGCTPGASMRMGDYKLLEFFEDGRLELYNLRDDIGEAHDLAAAEPQRVAAMHAKLRAWQQRMNAQFPAINPDYQPPADPMAHPMV